MKIESLLPFAIVIAPYILAILIESVVILYLKICGFWSALGYSFLINFISLAFIFYLATVLIAKLNYQVNGMNLPLPVVFFLWWFSSVIDGLLLQFFFKRKDLITLYKASILMNALSYLFLYIIIKLSH